jgi:hypothetical protein
MTPVHPAGEKYCMMITRARHQKHGSIFDPTASQFKTLALIDR